MSFASEREFEDALIAALTSQYGWDSHILENPTQKDLEKNWARILFENNRTVDRLNDYPLTDGETSQILERLAELKTPVKLNGFINGRFVTIKRDNPDDEAHFGKEISLKIYDRSEIAGGTSRYQIARQPQFPTRSKLGSDRRGDLTLLINGMPVIHLELKKSGVPLGQACNQLRKYSDEGVFTGIFSLVQVFVAMSPEETVYFANPGSGANFNSSYFFHWADFNNEPINDWRSIARELLSIPMAHQLIGFYTVADDADGTLKVMHSYQYYAAKAISDAAARTKWDGDDRLGGYVWHTTGSGKTMTSFKSAQLIRASGDADKVVFLVDRIELGTQSFKEYNSFANDDEEVQGTENTGALVAKLKSCNPSDGLIVTSIQKMCRIRNEDEGGLKASDVELMKSKRVVFIVDECHRSTFGDMLTTIKRTFPNALFFGFTGTPIQEENQKKESTTATVFGNELHRYSIADGIRDENVLGFDPYKILTFKDDDLREAVALRKSGAANVDEALADPKKKKTFDQYYNLPLGGRYDEQGKFVKGVENYLPNSQYGTEHKKAVVKDILDGWTLRSRARKFCAILATSSIPDAIEYYRLFKATGTDLKITALFDPNIDDKDRFEEWSDLEDPTSAPTYSSFEKEKGLLEIIEDYNRLYDRNYDAPSFQNMKKEISARLAHKAPWQHIDKKPDERVDLLIVVDQMLTGFDSKWVNTLYLDKELRYENIIQAFSRTNRLFGRNEKPFGMIRYYRRPHTMENAIAAAVKLYSGDKPLGLFVDRLPTRLLKLNALFGEIRDVFHASCVENFEKLPREKPARQKFAALFNNLQKSLEAAKIQGFDWDQSEYESESEDKTEKIVVELTREIYDALSMRYRELHKNSDGTGGIGGESEAPYDVETRLTSIETDAIDKDYINAFFQKFLKSLSSKNAESIRLAEDELHRKFATLSQEDQALATRFLGDVQRGDVKPVRGRKFSEYLAEYRARDEQDRIAKFAQTFGLDEAQLREVINKRPTEDNINEYGQFDNLKATRDKGKAKAFFEAREGKALALPRVNQKFNRYLLDFVLGRLDDAAN